MFKKFFVLLMVFSLCMIPMVAYATPTDASDKEELGDLADFESQIPEEVMQLMKKQEKALVNYQNLMNSFSKNELGLPIYPEEYGGAYIDDAGNLVIQLTDTSKKMKSKYIELCGSSIKIIFNKVDNSLNKLSSYESYAEDMMQSGYEVVSFGVDEAANSFNIYLSSDSEEASAASLFSLTEETDLPIKILYQSTPIACAATIWGGEAITNSKGTMSVGACGTYNGKKALLTCGHGNEGKPKIYYAGSEIGQVSYQRANTGEVTYEDTTEAHGDFAIVTLNDDVTITNRLQNGIQITDVYSYVPQGMTIYKYGQKTGYSYGTVEEPSITSVISHKINEASSTIYYIRRLCKSSMQKVDGSTPAVAGGDSGGSVYVYVNSKWCLHGIVTAGVSPTMYSTPVSYAINVGFNVKIN